MLSNLLLLNCTSHNECVELSVQTSYKIYSEYYYYPQQILVS